MNGQKLIKRLRNVEDLNNEFRLNIADIESVKKSFKHGHGFYDDNAIVKDNISNWLTSESAFVAAVTDHITDNNNYVVFAQNKHIIGMCYYIGFYSKALGFHFMNNIDGVEVGLHPYDESISNM